MIRSAVTPSLFTIAAAVAALGTGACTDDAGAPPDDFAALGGTWHERGPARFSATPVVDDPTPAPVGPDHRDGAGRLDQAVAREHEPAVASTGTLAIRAVDVRGRREYEVTIERAALQAIGAFARAGGLDQGLRPIDVIDTGGGDGGRPPAVTFGWSGNADSRTLRTSTTAWPFRTIGTLFDGAGDCTGTLVGPRHVLTAAHCIYSRKYERWNTITFTPGRNGAASAPYGNAGPTWYWVPQQYLDGAAGLNGYDIGLIVLDRPIGNGWMGYGAYASSSLDNVDLLMRGYPRCGVTGAPVKPGGGNCDPKTLWGDTQVCGLGTFFNEDGDGWNREIKTNCDGSDGQSGSSFYFTSPSSGNPVSMGVFSQHYCLGTCTGDEAPYINWPNVITRITPTYRDMISYFRSAYPS